MNKKIAFYDAKPWEKSLILETFNADELLFCDESVCEANAQSKETVEIISCFINSKLDKGVLSLFPNLKYVTTRSTGYDHIDLEYCNLKGIKVSNVPNYGKHTVAEHALTLLLTVVKRIPESLQRVSNGSFNPENLTGVDVFGKTIGVLGTGNIGASMIRMSLGMGMKVLAYDIKPSDELSTTLGFKYCSLEEVLAQSDFISVHLPYLKSTHHLINNESIMKMKKGVIIINTARGAIIDTRALLQNLRNGYLGGAGLDVLENEKDIDDELSLLVGGGELSLNEAELIIQNNVLIKMPNVVVTPHNAFNTKEALNRITAQTIQNIKAFQSNNVINLVN